MLDSDAVPIGELPVPAEELPMTQGELIEDDAND
jgi:hypothetical protein